MKGSSEKVRVEREVGGSGLASRPVPPLSLPVEVPLFLTALAHSAGTAYCLDDCRLEHCLFSFF